MNSEDILQQTLQLVTQGYCKDLARTKNRINSPQGEWLGVNPKDPDSIVGFTDATAWSIMGAVLRAEFFYDKEVPKNNSQQKSKPAWVLSGLSSQAHLYLGYAAKERGFNYVADFESDRKTDQAAVIALIERAIDFYNQEFEVNEQDHSNHEIERYLCEQEYQNQL
jgi:hypothetical protein